MDDSGNRAVIRIHLLQRKDKQGALNRSDSWPSNTIRNFNECTIHTLNKIPLPVYPEKGIYKGISAKTRRRTNMRGATESMLLAEAALN